MWINWKTKDPKFLLPSFSWPQPILHWKEWFRANIMFKGFRMVFGYPNHHVQWFLMVVHYQSDYAMVIYHRPSLARREFLALYLLFYKCALLKNTFQLQQLWKSLYSLWTEYISNGRHITKFLHIFLSNKFSALVQLFLIIDEHKNMMTSLGRSL